MYLGQAQPIEDRHSLSSTGKAYRGQAQGIQDRHSVSMTSTAYRGQAQRIVDRHSNYRARNTVLLLYSEHCLLFGSFSGVVQHPVSALFLAYKMNHLKRKLPEIKDNIDDSICAMSSTPGTSAAGASRAVAQGQQGNSSKTETVSFATRAADSFRYLSVVFYFLICFFFCFLYICKPKVSLPCSRCFEF